MDIPPHLTKYISNSDLFAQSMTHRSYINESSLSISNERLEFLGDAILEFIISNLIYHQFPNEAEGTLTSVRSYLVQTQSLSKIANELKLGDYLYLAKGEEMTGGRQNPSLLENAFEALIGAIFLDKGLNNCEQLINDTFLDTIQNLNLTALKDPKSQLQELVQSQGLPTPIYKVISESGPDHNKEFTISVIVNNQEISQGKGKSKQQAQQDAATQALIITRQNS